MYSSYFNGWIGKLDEFWTKPQRLKLFSSLFVYFQKRIHSGQKIFIGYDNNQAAKYLAIEAAEFFSENGIPVFISNRPLITSMLQIITKERYGCGSLSFVCDDYSFPYVGLKASNMEGIFINENDLNMVEEFKKQKKQPIDWFDPVLNLKNYLENHFDFSNPGKAMNSLVWNAVHSPLSPILEEIFVDIFNKTSIDAYTINSYENTLTKDVITEFDIQEQIDLTSLKMNEYFCQYGVTTSPDVSKFDVLTEKNGKIQPVSFEEIVKRIIPYLNYKETIIISENVPLFKGQNKNFDLKIKRISDRDFFNVIKNEPFSIAIDGNENIYLQSELFPNSFATLFCLYHSLIYIPKKNRYLNPSHEKEKIQVEEIKQ